MDVHQTGREFQDERGMFRFLFGIITVFDVAAVDAVVRRVALVEWNFTVVCCILSLCVHSY